VNGETHFANVDEPSIPAALEDVVGGFLGLDDFKLRSNIVRPQYTSTKGVHTLVPDDLAAIYNIAPLYAAGIDGTGQKIAIIGDSSLDLSDIRAFRKQFNLPASDPQQILSGVSELCDTVTATLSVALAAASAAPAAMTAAPQTITLAVADAFRSTATDVALTFTGGAPQWAASVVPGANWLTVSPLSGTGSGPPRIAVSAAGLSKGAYAGLVTVQSGDAIPQAINVPVTLVVGASQSTIVTAIANGASYTQAFAPGVLMTVFGAQLAAVTRSAGALPLPLELGGVSATVNGVSAPLYYVSPGQINVQVPYETGIGLAVLGVDNNGQVASFPFVVAPAAPSLFTAPDGSLTPAATARQGQTAVAYITGDGDITTFLITGASPPAGTATSRLPRPRLPVTVTVGGVAATVSFAGTPVGLAGVSQVNFTVPATVPPGVQPVVVGVGGVRTQTGRLTVTQ